MIRFWGFSLLITAILANSVAAQTDTKPRDLANLKLAFEIDSKIIPHLSEDSVAVKKTLDYLSEALAITVMEGTGKTPTRALQLEAREQVFKLMKTVFALEKELQTSAEFAKFAATKISDDQAQILLKRMRINTMLAKKHEEKRELEILAFLGPLVGGFTRHFERAMVISKRWKSSNCNSGFEHREILPYEDMLIEKLKTKMSADEKALDDIGIDELDILNSISTIWLEFQHLQPRNKEPFSVTIDSLKSVLPTLTKKHAPESAQPLSGN
jgi:hypothetical protein